MVKKKTQVVTPEVVVTVPQKKKSFVVRFFGWVWRHKWWSLLAIVLLVGGWFLVFGFGGGAKKGEFVTVPITRGDLSQTVTATGEIMPVNTVNVGSQVSGTIDEIYVDYNSTVKKGDMLLTIDPSVLQSSVDEAQASLTSAESQLAYKKAQYERNKTLYDDGFISRAEMEQSQTEYEQAEQNVKKLQYSYDRAVTNLGYATITSPVDGTVISRKVDKGQTVAASFQTPDLFEIAEDLTKMQIETAVSEADIGLIKSGMAVTFTVDAYPIDTFKGFVRQVRLSPTTTSNVVVYTVVIDVDNQDLRLMPGMTAFVTIIVSASEGAWKAQNAGFLLKDFSNVSENVGDATPNSHLAVMRDGEVIFVPYEKGLVTATETEIISDKIQQGDRIIVGRVGQESTNKKATMRSGGHPGGRPF
ncbi:MAG: efflux RND transporter periplasmic adaptor subunit [Alphaproteobacteria bacterium]|nr:efflux RND transporter periplasmic adaptor subunit [Alphaproteobacteria bacterium]